MKTLVDCVCMGHKVPRKCEHCGHEWPIYVPEQGFCPKCEKPAGKVRYESDCGDYVWNEEREHWVAKCDPNVNLCPTMVPPLWYAIKCPCGEEMLTDPGYVEKLKNDLAVFLKTVNNMAQSLGQTLSQFCEARTAPHMKRLYDVAKKPSKSPSCATCRYSLRIHSEGGTEIFRICNATKYVADDDRCNYYLPAPEPKDDQY